MKDSLVVFASGEEPWKGFGPNGFVGEVQSSERRNEDFVKLAQEIGLTKVLDFGEQLSYVLLGGSK
jgi:hypothetical protein